MIQKEFITLKNGETIAYLEAGVGSKTIIAIHGNCNSSYKMMPFLTHVEYSDCGHMIHFDQEEKFFKDYLDFINK